VPETRGVLASLQLPEREKDRSRNSRRDWMALVPVPPTAACYGWRCLASCRRPHASQRKMPRQSSAVPECSAGDASCFEISGDVCPKFWVRLFGFRARPRSAVRGLWRERRSTARPTERDGSHEVRVDRFQLRRLRGAPAGAKQTGQRWSETRCREAEEKITMGCVRRHSHALDTSTSSAVSALVFVDLSTSA